MFCQLALNRLDNWTDRSVEWSKECCEIKWKKRRRYRAQWALLSRSPSLQPCLFQRRCTFPHRSSSCWWSSACHCESEKQREINTPVLSTIRCVLGLSVPPPVRWLCWARSQLLSSPDASSEVLLWLTQQCSYCHSIWVQYKCNYFTVCKEQAVAMCICMHLFI